MNESFLIWLEIWNAAVFIMYGIDKGRSRKNKWRISEKTLLLWSAAAPFGAVFGTKVFRHKTQKLKFDTVLFVSCIVHILLYGTVLYMIIT